MKHYEIKAESVVMIIKGYFFLKDIIDNQLIYFSYIQMLIYSR